MVFPQNYIIYVLSSVNLRFFCHISQELQTKYNALLQMYGEKQEETEELKLDLQDIKNMYKAQVGGRLHRSSA